MDIIDSHCHLQDEKLISDITAVIQRALDAGVCKVVCCGTSEDDWGIVERIYKRYINIVIPSFGLHPWFVRHRSTKWTEKLEKYISEIPSGVGEIGLDFAIDGFSEILQKDLLLQQIEMAQKYGRPVSIHCRRAWEALLDVLKQTGPVECGGIIHSYSGSAEIVEEILKYNLSISFSGSITRSGNKRGHKSLQAVPLQRLLAETDSPDLSPAGTQPPNEPGNLIAVIDAIAGILGISAEEAGRIVSENAYDIFGEIGTD